MTSALYDFTATTEGALSLVKGQVLTVILQEPGGWWKAVSAEGQVGWIPATYIRKFPELIPPELGPEFREPSEEPKSNEEKEEEKEEPKEEQKEETKEETKEPEEEPTTEKADVVVITVTDDTEDTSQCLSVDGSDDITEEDSESESLKSTKSNKSTKSSKSIKSNKSTKSSKSIKSVKSEQPKSIKSVVSINSEKSGKSSKSVKSFKSVKSVKSEPSAKSARFDSRISRSEGSSDKRVKRSKSVKAVKRRHIKSKSVGGSHTSRIRKSSVVKATTKLQHKPITHFSDSEYSDSDLNSSSGFNDIGDSPLSNLINEDLLTQSELSCDTDITGELDSMETSSKSEKSLSKKRKHSKRKSKDFSKKNQVVGIKTYRSSSPGGRKRSLSQSKSLGDDLNKYSGDETSSPKKKADSKMFKRKRPKSQRISRLNVDKSQHGSSLLKHTKEKEIDKISKNKGNSTFRLKFRRSYRKSKPKQRPLELSDSSDDGLFTMRVGSEVAFTMPTGSEAPPIVNGNDNVVPPLTSLYGSSMLNDEMELHSGISPTGSRSDIETSLDSLFSRFAKANGTAAGINDLTYST